MKKRIWGIHYTEIYNDRIIWIAEIKERFYYKGKWVVGINDKFLREARQNDVLLRIKVGDGAEIPMQVPTEKDLKCKLKAKEYEKRKSNFENGNDMLIYYFEI